MILILNFTELNRIIFGKNRVNFYKIAARLERKSFCEEVRRTKDWEWKAEIAAQIEKLILKTISSIFRNKRPRQNSAHFLTLRHINCFHFESVYFL